MAKFSIAIVTNILERSLLLESFQHLVSDYEIYVFTTTPQKEYIKYPFPIVQLKSVEEDRNFMQDLGKRLESFNIIVCDENTTTYAFQALKTKKQVKNKLVVYTNSPLTHNPLHNKNERTISHEVSQHTDHFLTHSAISNYSLIASGVAKHKVTLLPPVSDLSLYKPAINRALVADLRSEYNLNENDIFAICTTPIELNYGTFCAINALKMMEQYNPSLFKRFKLLFCTFGNLGSQLKQYITELGLGNHVFFLPPENIFDPRFYQMADLFIDPNPGTSEDSDDTSLSIFSYVRALSCGIPIIAVGNYFNRNIIKGHGLLFHSGDHHKLYRYIEKLAKNKGLYQKFSQNGVKYAENHFNSDLTATSLNKLMKRLNRNQEVVEFNQIDIIIEEIQEYMEANNYIDAIDLIESCLKISELNINQQTILHQFIGDCFTKLGDYQSGEESYQRCLNMNPTHAKALIGLGTIKLQQQGTDQAILYFQKAIEHAPKNDMAMLGLGLSFQQMGLNDEALLWSSRALDVNTHNTAAIYTLTQISYDTNKFDKIEKHLENYIEEHPHDTDFIFSLAGIKYRQGKSKEAQGLLNEILSINPNDNRAIDLLELIETRSYMG